jgi:hypothetical protein
MLLAEFFPKNEETIIAKPNSPAIPAPIARQNLKLRPRFLRNDIVFVLGAVSIQMGRFPAETPL